MNQELNPINNSEPDMMDIDEGSDTGEHIEVVQYNPNGK